MSPEDFKAQFENFRKASRPQGQPSRRTGRRAGIDRQMLTQLALQESLAELIRKMGVRPSDKLVGDTVREQMSQPAARPASVRPDHRQVRRPACTSACWPRTN
jgi:peptidyl-prolyl cis-trans isomerase D